MIIIFRKAQISLFDAPVHVGPHVRKDGTVVKPYTRVQKVAPKKPEPVKAPAQADMFSGAPKAPAQHDLFGSAPVEPVNIATYRDRHKARDEMASREIAGLELRHQSGRSWALLVADASNPGKFRYQTFDEKGPQGHSTFNTAREALEGAWAAGYREKDQGAIDRLAAKWGGVQSSNKPEATAAWPGDLPETASDDERDDAHAAWRDALFDPPSETVRAEEQAKLTGFMPQERADEILGDWIAAANKQDKSKNSDKTILSLFDHTGHWSTPFIEAGYNVIQVDLKDGVDVMDFSPEYFADIGIDDVHGILAACPCTDFASSGARWWDAKDKDGRTKASIALVKQTLAIVDHFAPKFWAIENPVGRIEKMSGLNKPTLIFQPHHYGDPHTKKTMLYGKFNPGLPQSNVDPVGGSRTIKLSGTGKGKDARSETPSGFAYAFFMANGDVQPGTERPKDGDKAGGSETLTADLWNSLGYGGRQSIAESAYSMRSVVHRISGSKWHELGPGEQKSMLEAYTKTKGGAEKPEPKEGDTKTENGIEYRLQDGRWHRVTPEQESGEHVIVEHVTKKGKTLRGVVRADLTKDEAEKIDPYTFKKDGGFFIREKYLTGTAVSQAPVKQKPASAAKGSEKKAGLAKESVNQAARPEFVGAGNPEIEKLLQSVRQYTGQDMPAMWSEFELSVKLYGFATASEHLRMRIKELMRKNREGDIGGTVDYSAGFDPAAVPAFGVTAGTGKAERRRINADVIKALESDEPDHNLLRQYSGNGGCGDSLNEFYTDPKVAAAMWATLAKLGHQGGTALEPSCATGVFMHTAPAGTRVTGVELDPVSAKVAGVLHGDRHEVVTASLERFATTDDRQFDVVIGNPPYGPRGYLIKDDKKDISTAEQYFTDTALDKCKPGGLVALVVPTGILDSKSGRAFREDLLRKGQFLGALRMPNTAFEHSHTEVTTDVVFFRKRGDDVAGALSTVDQATLQKLGVWDDEFLSGGYFTGRGTSNVLGAMTEGWRAKAGMGQDITVEGSMRGVPEAIAAFEPDPVSAGHEVTVQRVLEALGDDETGKDRAVSAAARRPYANTAKPGDTKTVDGVTYVLQGNPPRWHRVDEFMQSDAITDAQVLAAEIDGLLSGQAVDHPDLEKRVRAYVARHGIPANNLHLMAAAGIDKTLYRLIGAVNKQGEISDAVAGRGARKVEGTFDTVAQALALERESGDFSVTDLAARLGKDQDETLDHLLADARYAWAGADRWSPMGAYLTGELWPKLDAVNAALADSSLDAGLRAKCELQAERLAEIIAPRSLEEVDFQLNSAFLPLKVLEAYFNWRKDEGPGANKWTKEQPAVSITFKDSVYIIQGGNRHGDIGLLDKYLNRTGVRKDDMPVVEALNAEFKDWLCTSQYRDEVEDLYNRKFRGFVAKQHTNDPIDVPGLANADKIRPWRWSSLRNSLALGKGIVADDVGLGKTVAALLLARMAKMQGKAQRPIIVVPKSVLANWYAETQMWFPGSKALTIGANFAYDKDGSLTGKDDNANERKRKYHDLTQNDYDFVVISQPAFEEIDLDPETKENYYSSDFWVQRGESLGNAGDKRRKAIKERYDQYIANREFEKRTDAIYFNDLGVDMLIQDEAHSMKNLYAARARFGESPKFLGGQGLSNRALDFNLKARWIREHNDGKGVYGLTATPTKNSPLEVYSMLSHIAPEEFERTGIRNSEEFLDRFCEFVGDKVLSTKGDIEDALVTAGFKNMDELREIMAKYIDRRTAEQVGLKLPERQDRMHLVDMSEDQRRVYSELRALAAESAGKRDATGDAHIFSIMDKMGKAALDLELLDGAAHAGARSPKIEELAENVKRHSKDGGQIVFCESLGAHDKIVAALIKQGFKKAEIGIINAQAAGSAVKRQNIADAFNAGKLKVVVGNCIMAEGMNLQKTTTDIHHLDIPWEPATLQQRNGRGLRQGNNREAVRIHTYLARGSFDGYRYQATRAKKDWQDLLWSGGDRVENLAREGNISRDEMLIMLSADPDEARKKFDEDKAAAMQRHESGERSKAMGEFVRFQELSRSYGGIKNKNTQSANRLREKMEAAKQSLFRNKHFPAKEALDSHIDLLVEPDTGAVFRAGVGVDAGEDGKMVVTGVNMKAGTVTLRKYAHVGGDRPVTVPVSELKHGVKTFAVDEKEEAAEVGRKLETEALDKANNLKGWDDLKQLPPSVLEANHDAIQRQLKQGAKDYTFNFPYGDVPMVDRATGALKMVESYNHRGMADTHDYLLPTEAAKDKAMQAWMDSRRNARIDYEYVQRRSGRGSRSGASDRMPRRAYKDASYTSKSTNPFRGLLAHLSGESTYGVPSKLEREAKKRLHAEQMQRIRHAASSDEAIEALMPLGRVSGEADKGHARFPKDALAMAWARARRLGQLDNKVDGAHSNYAYAGGNRSTVHGALIRMARASGHRDLAEAIAETAERHGLSKNDEETIKALANHFEPSERTLSQIKRVAERMKILDASLEQLHNQKLELGGPFARRTGYGYYGGQEAAERNRLTLRAVIDRLTPKKGDESGDEQ